LPDNPAHNGFLPFGDFAGLDIIDQRVAAVICESVPSLAGIYLAPDGYYAALAARCRAVGALLIFDEVQGGIGRLGSWSAHHFFGIQPELVTLAKSIAGGFPAGALLVAEALVSRVQHGELGTTFGGGPLACRMIAATARTILSEKLMQRTPAIFARIAQGLAGIDGVEVRGAGCLIGVQTPLPAATLRDAALARGLLVGTAHQPQTIRLLPPYIIDDEPLERFVTLVRELIATR
jgi:acetylornithine/succinyldiaminopimelate/putrescine aminotransferase